MCPQEDWFSLISGNLSPSGVQQTGLYNVWVHSELLQTQAGSSCKGKLPVVLQGETAEPALPWRALGVRAASPSCSALQQSCTLCEHSILCASLRHIQSQLWERRNSCGGHRNFGKNNQQTKNKTKQNPNYTENSSKNKEKRSSISIPNRRTNHKSKLEALYLYLHHFPAKISCRSISLSAAVAAAAQTALLSAPAQESPWTLTFLLLQSTASFALCFSHLFKILVENLFITQIHQISDAAFLFLENRDK